MMCAMPLAASTVRRAAGVDPGPGERGTQSYAEPVGPDRADHHHLAAGAGGGDGLVGALAAGDGAELAAGYGLPEVRGLAPRRRRGPCWCCRARRWPSWAGCLLCGELGEGVEADAVETGRRRWRAGS